MRIKKILQHDEKDCGAACLAIILAYYGSYVPLHRILQAAGSDSSGTSGYGIARGAAKFGLSCKGFASKQKTAEELSDVPLPAILHLIEENHDHYVVVYRVNKKKVFVSDPAIGLCKIELEKFRNEWTGVFFLLSPTSSFSKFPKDSNIMLRFLSLLRPYKSIVVKLLIASLFISLFGVFIAFYFRFLIDEVLYNEVRSTLHVTSVCYLIILIFQAVLSFCRSQIIIFLGSKIDVALLSDFFFHLLHLPMKFFTARKTGEILSRIYDVETIRNAVSSTSLSVVMDSIMIIIGGLALFIMGSSLVPVAIAPIIISSFIVWLFAGPFKRLIREKAVLEADKNASIYESINGIATIKGLSTERQAFLRTESRIVAAAHKSLSLSCLGNWQNSLENFISGVGTLSLYWFGSYLIFEHNMTLGQLISFITLSGFFLNPLSRLLTMQSYWQEVFVASERLADVLDTEEEEEPDGKMEAKSLIGDIEFHNVSFAYGTRGNTLKNVSFTIHAGEKVAFVGLSGSGKTTLLKLLMRFYPCSEGRITIDGTDISDYTLESYREKIGYVPQESLLFSGTIEENIAWGFPIADSKLVHGAAQVAQAWEFISRLPDRMQTVVGEQGATLSGGERQRIALARVLLRSPQMLILDEATASLDSISEQAIMDTIFKYIKKRCVIMVAHRLSTIKNCDRIFVFDRGQLVESGNHSELLAKGEKYYSLWRAQNQPNDCKESYGSATQK